MAAPPHDLAALLRGVEVLELSGPDPSGIVEVRDDSRQVGPGALFVAVRGQSTDGHAYLELARSRGAVAAVVEDPGAGFAGRRVLVRSAVQALAQIAANFYGRPAEALPLVGVTGTNGKTTISYLTESLLLGAGQRPGVIGTVAYRSPAGTRPAPFTTPTPLTLHATLAEMRDAGCSHVVMECSSHALALDRLYGVSFAVAAFSNLTQDHLDLHGEMKAYGEAKARLFTEHLRKDGVAVICVDAAFGEALARACPGRVLRVSATGKEAEVRVRSVEPTPSGTALVLATPAGPLSLVSPLVGGFNVENLAVSVGIALALGLSRELIRDALAEARGAPGRLERVASATLGITAYVDYAHTPDALERALAALRPTTQGRLWVVFGCGGDRDRGKRPLMGAIAEAGADRVIITSDNPRTEPPRAILDEIVAGLRAPHTVEVVEDRRRAIGQAVAGAAPGDVILVAGKGHEDYQIVGRQKLHFDDRDVLREAFSERSAQQPR